MLEVRMSAWAAVGRLDAHAVLPDDAAGRRRAVDRERVAAIECERHLREAVLAEGELGSVGTSARTVSSGIGRITASSTQPFPPYDEIDAAAGAFWALAHAADKRTRRCFMADP